MEQRRVATETDIRFAAALSECGISLSYLKDNEAHRVVINAPSHYAANKLVGDFTPMLALQAKVMAASETHVYYPDCQGKPLVVPVWMAETEDADIHELLPPPDMIQPVHNLLLGADYCAMHDFLKEQRQQGKIVIITSNTTDVCYHTNDLLSPKRGKRQPHEWIGYNYLRSWRADRTSRPIDGINSQYERLKNLLARDGYVPGYEYELFRPDIKTNPDMDSWVTYKTDYYLCNDYLGDQVRIGVSHPDDYSVLEQPTGAIAGR